MQLMKKLIMVSLLIFTSLFCLSAFSYVPPHFGGEIPWPLSRQRIVTVENSQGLWRLKDQSNRARLFNVEMVHQSDEHRDWIRVSELNPETYEVLTWGEGFFADFSKGEKDSSFFDVTLDSAFPKNDPHGRYLSMFKNGDINNTPFVVRLVEVKTTIGHVLGLSIFSKASIEGDHMLGTRVSKRPMLCGDGNKDDVLTCFFDNH
jgi:hypothetical protein